MMTHLPILSVPPSPSPSPSLPSSVDPGVSLATLALSRDAHAAVLARHKLDFCCGGKRTLRDACEAAGLDVAKVVAELDAEVAAREEAAVDHRWDDRPLGELIDFITDTHHVYTHSALARIAPLAEKVAKKHGERHPELAQAARAFDELARDLSPHLVKEESVLFPYLRLLASPAGAPPPPFGTVRNPVRMMMSEHDRAGELLAEIAAATDDHQPPKDACTSFRALYAAFAELHLDLMKHVSLENNVLFPRALRLEEEHAKSQSAGLVASARSSPKARS